MADPFYLSSYRLDKDKLEQHLREKFPDSFLSLQEADDDRYEIKMSKSLTPVLSLYPENL
ncbi:uncharacterized protein PG998_000132 [Apiospora kogelbergensis]|uniref:uncharacterized protein n=1 Tax=Apiospora kogelbergensis TaxID=1337665 RepID=UPI003131A21A